MLIDMFSRGKLCSLLVGLRSVKSLLSVSKESLYLVFEFVAAAYMLGHICSLVIFFTRAKQSAFVM